MCLVEYPRYANSADEGALQMPEDISNSQRLCSTGKHLKSLLHSSSRLNLNHSRSRVRQDDPLH